MKKITPNPKEYIAYYSRIYPSAWKQVDQFRAGRGKELPFWPSWCFMPLAGAYTIISLEAEKQSMNIADKENIFLFNDVGIIGALAAWRATQGIYRFDPDIYAEIIKTPLVGDLPHQILFNLPEWCVYIETPGMTITSIPMRGFFAYLEQDANSKRTELRFVFDFTPDISEDPLLMQDILYLGPWPLSEAVSRKLDEAARLAKTKSDFDLLSKKDIIIKGSSGYIAPLISLLLYICSINADIEGKDGRKPAKPQAKKTKKGDRLFPPDRISTWDVGVRMGAALRQARESAPDDETATSIPSRRSGPRPHVRRAHWHLYWTGPKDREQKPVVKWLPPIPVNVNNYEELPAVVHKIEKNKESSPS